MRDFFGRASGLWSGCCISDCWCSFFPYHSQTINMPPRFSTFTLFFLPPRPRHPRLWKSCCSHNGIILGFINTFLDSYFYYRAPKSLLYKRLIWMETHHLTVSHSCREKKEQVVKEHQIGSDQSELRCDLIMKYLFLINNFQLLASKPSWFVGLLPIDSRSMHEGA